jgi:hypothetical protein
MTERVKTVEADPPEFEAVTVKAVDAKVTVGVPVRSQLGAAEKLMPAGKLGEMEHVVIVPPVLIGR